MTLTASIGASPVAAQDQSKPVVIQAAQQLRHFNGAIQSGLATATASTQIFASPLRYDDKWNPKPYLAESWEVAPDGLSITLHLVKNALFHDGKPVTSEDVAFSIMLIKANHPFKTMLQPVEKVDTPDLYTAIIRLAHPHPALLLAMSPALMPILPKHVYGVGGDIQTNPANLKPVGSGPFKLIEYKQGDHYTLEKFHRFFIKDRPILDKIIVRTVTDQGAAVVAMERGEANIYPFINGIRDIERLENAPNLFVTAQGFEGIGALNWLEFNTKKKPLDDVRVRQAIAYAANRDFIVKKLMRGKAAPAYTPIAPGSPFEEKDVEQYNFNLAKANKLLDEAGYRANGNGTRFSLTIDYMPGTDEQQRNIAEYMRSALKRVGIELEVRSTPDFPTWAQRVSNFDFDMTMDNVFNWGDPVIGVGRTYLGSNIRKGVVWANMTQYANPKVDGLLDRAAKATSVEERKDLYSQFQKIISQEVPIFFINATPYHIAFDKRLGGLPTTIWGIMSPLDELHWKSN